VSVLALTGWLAAGAAVVFAIRVSHHQRRSIRRAEHELRSALCGLRLGLDGDGRACPRALAGQFDRVDAGLALIAEAAGQRRSPQRGPVSLETLAHDSAAAWAPAAQALGRRLEVEWDAGPALVKADRRGLAQVTGNLIANALEHGSGRIRLTGALVGKRVALSVQDEGRITRGARPGRGQGLDIAREAAQQNGGTLGVRAGADGTTATLELPAAPG
jgi:signal transduction histidine kinase